MPQPASLDGHQMSVTSVVTLVAGACAACSASAAIVSQRAAFVEELAYRLERAEKLSGDTVGALWREFYPREQAAAASPLQQRGSGTRTFAEGITFRR